MPLERQVHKYEDRDGRTILTKFTPYIRLKDGDMEVYLQKGRIYSASGDKLEPIPDWVWPAIESLDKKFLEEHGFHDDQILKLKNYTLPPEPEEPPEPPPTQTLEEPVIPERLLTEEEANDMEFATLRAYANRHGITGRARGVLISQLKEEGLVH